VQPLLRIGGLINPGLSDQVLNALKGYPSGSRELTFRYELLDETSTKIADLHNIISCTVSYNYLADICRTAKFEIGAADAAIIDFANQRIKPWIGVTDYLGNYNEWPQGVFLLSSPTKTMIDSENFHVSCDAYDYLQIYTDNKVSNRYEAASGSLYTDSISSLLAIETTNAYSNASNAVSGGAYASGGSAFTNARVGDSAGSSESTSVIFDTTNYLTAAQQRALLQLTFSAHTGGPGLSFTVRGELSNESTAATGTSAYFAKTRTVASVIVTGDASTMTAKTVDVTAIVNEITSQVGWTGPHIQFFVDNAGSTASTDVQVKNNVVLVAGLVTANVTPSTLRLPAAMDFDPGTSYLAIINALLAAINYDSLFFDENGQAICRQYQSPSLRPSTFTYIDDEKSVQLPNASQLLDLFAVPNSWTMIVSNADQPTLSSSYTNTNPGSPTSTVARGRTILDYQTGVAAADLTTLTALVAKTAFNASQVYEVVKFSTAIMPIHGHNDVFTLTYSALGLSSVYSEHTWSIPFVAGGVMTHEVRRIVSV
jgi:hypothetical protein